MATRSLNKVQLIGNLTRDPELRYTSSGTPVVSFSVATNRTYTDSSGKVVEDAEFTNVVAWSKLAEICSQLLKKGMKVFVEGRLQTSKWNDKETGKAMYRTEVVANEMIILTPSRGVDGGSYEKPETEETSAAPSASEDVDDIDLDNLDLGEIEDSPESETASEKSESVSKDEDSKDESNDKNDDSSSDENSDSKDQPF